VLSWSGFTGGTTADTIVVEIESDDGAVTVFETPFLNEIGALDGTATSVNVPAYTLAPNRTYAASLAFAKVVQQDTNTYPGVAAATAYYSATALPLQTVGETLRPTLTLSLGSNAVPHLTVTGERDRFYTIEVSDHLASGATPWTPWFGGYASDPVTGFWGSFELDDDAPVAGGTRFYRAYEGSSFGGP